MVVSYKRDKLDAVVHMLLVKRENEMSDSIHTITDRIVVFTLDEQSYALSLKSVVKVIHAIEIRYLPKAPEIIIGIINVKGQIIPVVDIRRLLGLVTHEIGLNDQLIIADTGKRQVAILVDTVMGTKSLTPSQLSVAIDTLPFAEHIEGVAKVDDDLIYIYDLNKFLSLDEEKKLERALKMKKNES